jgi:D-alanyl-D-alanine carboxypeptidase
MTSVLQGGRRRRRRIVGLARLAVVLALLGGAVAGLMSLNAQRRAAATKAPLQAPAAAGPATSTSAPDPAQAALAGADAFRLGFKQPPSSAIVFDVTTGEVLWRREPLKQLPIASLTKIMTALLVVEHTQPGEMIRVPKDALSYSGSGVGLLPKGRHVTVEALLHGLLLPSGNDAAIALADHVAGSRGAFVAQMNKKARLLGLRCTVFASPSGIEDADRSCAGDLAALSRIVMSKPRIAAVVGKTHAVVPFPIKGGKLYLNNTNPLLRMGYRGTIGLKTGDTVAAGHCLIAVVRRGGRTIAAIVLHSPNPAQQVRSLFAKAFSARV